METVHIKINNVPYEVAAGSTILEAAHSVGIELSLIHISWECCPKDGSCSQARNAAGV